MRHVLPLGVVEADNKREAQILAEHLRHEQRVLIDARIIARFEGPATAGQVARAADAYEALGVHVEMRWLFDTKGNRKGIELRRV